MSARGRGWGWGGRLDCQGREEAAWGEVVFPIHRVYATMHLLKTHLTVHVKGAILFYVHYNSIQ